MSYRIRVNGIDHAIDAEGDTPLLWVPRDILGMTGTRFGCRGLRRRGALRGSSQGRFCSEPKVPGEAGFCSSTPGLFAITPLRAGWAGPVPMTISG